jgi:lysophospholipase L1-like esterase
LTTSKKLGMNVVTTSGRHVILERTKQMNRRNVCVLILALVGTQGWDFGTGAVSAADVENPLELTLPSEFYAVVGEKTTIGFDNIVLTKTPEEYRFDVVCNIGRAGKTNWAVTPTAEDVGKHTLRVNVADANGKTLGSAKTTLRVVAADAGVGRTIRLLIVGDSLTHATAYPNEIARLLSKRGNPAWKMLGTHKPKNAGKGVAHEGYGGWTWQRFVTQYEPNPDGTYRKRSSPFVSLGDDAKPKLDVARYFKEECGGQRPDYVLFLLGINDCFSANPEQPDDRIASMLKQADILLAEFRRAAPKAELGICLTTPPNSRQAAFEANYKDRYSRWGWKQTQHRLVQMEIKHFGRQEDKRMFVVPTEMNLDPTAGYPANNGVHPNTAGYQQLGGSIYAWLKHRLDIADKGLKRSAK